MKVFKVTVEIAAILGGVEVRVFYISARTSGAAEKRVRAMMGNRDYWVKSVEVAQ